MKVTKYLKYVVVAGLAGALALAPVSEAIAAASAQESSSSSTPAPTTEEQRQTEINEAYEEMVQEASSPVNQTVEGTKSDVKGFYLAKSVQGVAIAPSVDSGADSNSYVRVMDTDKKKSTAAMNVANSAATLLNATVGPCINVNYGKMVGGRFSESTDGSKGLMNIGIPANFRTAGARYAVVAVYEGGLFRVYENIGTSTNSITVNLDQAPSANVMYALIKY